MGHFSAETPLNMQSNLKTKTCLDYLINVENKKIQLKSIKIFGWLAQAINTLSYIWVLSIAIVLILLLHFLVCFSLLVECFHLPCYSPHHGSCFGNHCCTPSMCPGTVSANPSSQSPMREDPASRCRTLWTQTPGGWARQGGLPVSLSGERSQSKYWHV